MKEKLKGRNFPNLRFPGFQEAWELKKLGEIGNIKMCRRIFNNETSASGEIPFFKIGSFGREADAFISKKLYIDYKKKFSFPRKGDILISAAGTIGRTVVYNGEDAYYQDSNIVWIENDNTKITNEFLFHILQIVKYNTEGGTIQRLYNNILKSTKFSSPIISEQTKIAAFLSLINERISTQKKIIEDLTRMKLSIAHKIFSQKIKFNNSNDWVHRKLEDLVKFHKGSYLSKGDISPEGKIKCVHYGELFTIYNEVVFSVISRTEKTGFYSKIGDILIMGIKTKGPKKRSKKKGAKADG